MVALVNELVNNRGKAVTLEFDDGEIIDARLLSIDPEEHEDIVFDVLAVRQPGRSGGYDPRNIYTAPIASVKRVQALEENPPG